MMDKVVDSFLQEALNPAEIWRMYVGTRTPLEFMNSFHTPEPRDCAEAFVGRLPHVFGVMRRQTWRESFESPMQLGRELVAGAIWSHLEETREDWEPYLNQQPPRAPEPEPEPVVEAVAAWTEAAAEEDSASAEAASAQRYAPPVVEAATEVAAPEAAVAPEEIATPEAPMALEEAAAPEAPSAPEGAEGAEQV